MRQYRGMTKDGKWVYGWLQIWTDGQCFISIDEDGIEVIPSTVSQYVTDDKNGDKVFAGDEIRGEIPDVSSKPLIGLILPNVNPLNCWMFKYHWDSQTFLAPAPDLKSIEIIKEADNATT